MKKTTKLLSVILAIALIMSIITIPAQAAIKPSSQEGHNKQIKWVISNSGVLTISKYTSDSKAEIPDYSTSNLPAWHKYKSSIKSIEIKNNITKIGSYSFWECDKATKVTIGKDVATINTAPFGQCDSIKSFTVDSSNANYATASSILYNKSKSLLVAYPANKSGDTYTAPDSVTDIKGFAFSNNKNVKKVTQNSPGHIKKINGRAFSGAKKLATITIKNNCTTLDNHAFYNCKTLENVTLPPSITSVGNDIFSLAKDVPKLRVHCSQGSAVYNKLNGKGYILTHQDWDFNCNFNANGGTVGTSVKTVTFNKKYGTLPTPTKTGTKFTRWVLNNKTITADTVVTTAASHTLTAEYNANTYTVTLNTNGGICNTESVNAVYNQPIGDLPTPTRVGYAFVGWFTSATGGDKVTTNTVYKLTSNSTIYARWEKPCETVTGIKLKYNSPDSVELSWDAQDKVTGYEIYQKINNDEYSLRTNCADNKAVLELNPNYKYTFRVRSYVKTVENSYIYGDFSNEVSRAKTYVSKPSVSYTYKKSNGLLTVKWSLIGNAEKYQIYQYKSNKWVNIKDTTSTKFYIYTKANKSYKFRVRALTTVLGHKYYSDYTNLTFNSKIYIKAPKVKYKFINNYKKLRLKWKKVAGAKGYKIYKYQNHKWKKIKTTTKKSYKYTIKKKNKYYRLKIRAYKVVNGKTYYSDAVIIKFRVRTIKK